MEKGTPSIKTGKKFNMPRMFKTRQAYARSRGFRIHVLVIESTFEYISSLTTFFIITVQLLHKLKVRSADGKATLLKVIKNPVTRYLPAGFKCYGFSVQGTLYNPNALACTLPDDKPVVFVLGAMAAGHITVQDHPYVSAAREAMMTL